MTGLATALVDPLTQAVVGALTTQLFGLVGSLGTTLTTTIGGPVVTALATVLAALPGVLSIRVNVQSSTSGTGAVDGVARSGRSTVTALRLSLADALVPGGLARVDLATAAVGPVTADLRGGGP